MNQTKNKTFDQGQSGMEGDQEIYNENKEVGDHEIQANSHIHQGAHHEGEDHDLGGVIHGGAGGDVHEIDHNEHES